MQKSHLVDRLSAEFGDSFGQAVSHTTRKPKDTESNGKQYHFVEDEQFQELIRRGLYQGDIMDGKLTTWKKILLFSGLNRFLKENFKALLFK